MYCKVLSSEGIIGRSARMEFCILFETSFKMQGTVRESSYNSILMV